LIPEIDYKKVCFLVNNKMLAYSTRIPKDDHLEGSELLILKAAQKVFLEFGYHGSTIKMIAELASISHSSVHYYFRTREVLFEIVFFRCMKILLDSIMDLDGQSTYSNLEQRRVKHPELLSIAWFVANEFRSNSFMVIEILRRNDEVRAKMKTVYQTPEYFNKFQYLINQTLMNSTHHIF
jgi:AcrR family transcriptional regulator